MKRCIGVLALLGATSDSAPRSQAAETTVGGYLELNYSLNFGRPRNRITALRAFDDRHARYQLSNLALDVSTTWQQLATHIVLQLGEAPNVYYTAEPSPNRGTLRHIQQATIGWTTGSTSQWLLEAGLFLSPIGPEGIAIRDDWNWSRSNLFSGLPTYHFGARATYGAGSQSALTLATYNGWNNIKDNNDRPSASVQWLAKCRPALTTSLLYFGGVERSEGAPEGAPRRDLLDAWIHWDLTNRFSLLVHGDAGRERNQFGTNSWTAAALAVRGRVAERLYLAARTDRFAERVPEGSTPIFWTITTSRERRVVASHTLTLDYRPKEKVSTRVELRRDRASGLAFFSGNTSDPNTRNQSTLTLGAVVWF